MKAITLWQPWASLVALGHKSFETRSWGTSYRGPILIHAAKKHLGPDNLSGTFKKTLRHVDTTGELNRPPLGVVVALADLAWVKPSERIALFEMGSYEKIFGDFSDGRFAWKLLNVRRLARPIPARGMQRLWTPSPELVEAVERQLREGAGGR